jgi:hypothetical protein
VTRGEISVGDLTSLLLYTVYVGSGLQMLTYVLIVVPVLVALTTYFHRSFFVCPGLLVGRPHSLISSV